MKFTKCENGHYYDAEIHAYCPYCENMGFESDDILNTMSRWAETSSYTLNTKATKGNEKEISQINANSSIKPNKDSININLLEEDFIFDRYKIITKIGEGGFSDVYKVKHKSLSHIYALKIFNQKESNSDNIATICAIQTNNVNRKDRLKELKKLFFQEAYNLAKLTSLNVVKVYDEGVFKNHAYILMEYIDGTRLDKIIKNIGNFTIQKTLDLLEDILTVLVEQESKNIIHADIKPNNIFLRKNNTFCLIDYGNMNNNTVKSYTKEFAAPEQIDNSSSLLITHSSDLYSLGLTAWYCLTGEIPNIQKWDYKIPKLSEYRDDIPNELLKIIDNLTQKDINNRYKCAIDALNDVQEYKDNKEKPIGAIKATIFIAISYNEAFSNIYNTLNETAKSLNCKCIRMDRLDFKDEIWKNIALEIEHSDIMIADFTNASRDCHANSNVITEAAHARAVGKDIIVITQNRPEDLPFDWRYLPTIQYEPSKEGLEILSNKIYNKLKRLIN